MQLKVSGKGNDSNNPNGISGDLLVLIEESNDNNFTREGKHLHYDLYISISEAALGVSKDIHLIDGKVRIKLESGIQSGKTLRLRNKGIPDLNGYSKGDLLVHVNIWTPKTLTKKHQKQKNQTKGSCCKLQHEHFDCFLVSIHTHSTMNFICLDSNQTM